MVSSKSKFRLIISFCLGLLLTILNTSVLAVNLPLQSQTTTNDVVELVENAKQNYNQELFQSSVTNLEQALIIFSQNQDTINQAIVLGNLSLAYQKLGEWNKAEKAINNSLDLLDYQENNNINNYTKNQKNFIADSLNIKGSLFYQQGKLNLALETWQKAENIYKQLNNNQGIISTQINQVKGLQGLGNYPQAVSLIENIQNNLEQAPPSLQVLGFKNLGDVLQAIGQLNQSEKILLKGKEIASENNLQLEIIDSINLSLGNNYWALGKLENERINSSLEDKTIKQDNYNIAWQCQFKPVSKEAQIYYQQAEDTYQKVINNQNNNSLKAKINLFNLLVETDKLVSAKNILTTINLEKLPANRSNIYAKINLARHLNCLSQNNSIQTNLTEKILNQSLTEAKELNDNHALSYAYGNFGSYYEYLSLVNKPNNQLLTNAEKLTKQALLLAQPNNNPEIAYQWQWQLGRIEALLGNTEKAISYYRGAVDSLTQVRRDLVINSADVQFSFRDNVEPIYRQLVGLLLGSEGGNPSQTTLVSAIDLVDSLQLAELENFLNCNLQITAQSNKFKQSNNTAFIYPIILGNRLDVVYKFPNQTLKYHSQPVNRQEVETTVDTIRKAIARRNPEVLKANTGKVYQWLIQPLNTYLPEFPDINNLVFILDGALRNVPMAVLYDEQNQEYLVEKNYALSLLPTSQLFNLSSQNKSVKVLGAGISEALNIENKSFAQINATEELEQVKEIASTTTLINEQFTQKKLQQQINQGGFSILHLATHGNFSSDPEDTFLLAYDKLLRANDLNNLLQSGQEDENKTIDLLILSACQTATGDNRATLGLAGLAIRAGAKSTLASLWRISDNYTIPLITRFYENLNQGLSKAEALHQAQKSLVYREINGQKYQNDPYDWGAYVLVGNWQ